MIVATLRQLWRSLVRQICHRFINNNYDIREINNVFVAAVDFSNFKSRNAGRTLPTEVKQATSWVVSQLIDSDQPGAEHLLSMNAWKNSIASFWLRAVLAQVGAQAYWQKFTVVNSVNSELPYHE
jgi:hypothetical protein